MGNLKIVIYIMILGVRKNEVYPRGIKGVYVKGA